MAQILDFQALKEEAQKKSAVELPLHFMGEVSCQIKMGYDDSFDSFDSFNFYSQNIDFEHELELKSRQLEEAKRTITKMENLLRKLGFYEQIS